MNVPLARPTFNEDSIQEYFGYLRDILKSGRLTLGKYLRMFEDSLKKFIGANYVLGMNSCTSALHAIMWALRIKDGDEVIVPTYTFASTVNAPIYVGARPVLVDSDIDTFNITVDNVLEKINPNTKAIIVVHVGGNPVDLKGFTDLVEDKGVILVEDAAHALGSYYKGFHVGNFGKAAAFSFYPNKIITTGEGGAAVTNDIDIAKKLEAIRCVGRYGLGPTEVVELGHNFRLSEINAALGLVQLNVLDRILENRRKIAEYYNKRFSSIECIEPQKLLKDTISSYYAYIIKIDPESGIDRDELRRILYEKYGIETTIIYKPVHLHKLYRKILDTKSGMFPNAEFLGDHTVALPIYGHMKIDVAKYVVDSIEEAISSLQKR